MPFNSNDPLGYLGINEAEQPVFLQFQRPPTTNDKYPAGSQIQDLSDVSKTIYETTGAGVWLSGSNAYATTTAAGIVQLSSSIAGDATSLTLVPTVKEIKDYVDSVAVAGAPVATTVTAGIGELATDAEAVAGTASTGILALLVTPSNLAAVFAAPPAQGGTTPAAGSFTTLAASGLSSLSGSATILTAGTALNLASDADTAGVNIGTGAAARVITIGNISGATAVAVNTGTGSFTVTSTGTGDIVLNSADTVLIDSAGVLELNSSAGVIGIGNDAVSQNINIGTGASARVITLGNSSGATAVTLNAGSAGVNVGTNAIAHTISIGNQTGTSSVVIDSGTGVITIGTAIAKTITIGNVTGTTGVAINVGTGNFAVNGVTNSTYNVGAATTTGSITIGGTAQTGDLVLGSSSGINAVKIMNGSGDGTLSLGVVQVAGAINMGTAMTTGTITIGGTGLQTGTVLLAPGTGAQTVGIATGGTGIKTVNIATGAIDNVVTIGSVTGAASMSLLVGTGNFALNGAATSTYTVGAATTTGTITIGGTAQTGTITLGSSSGTNIVAVGAGTGATTVDIAGGAGSAKVVNVATGAVANVLTLGTVSGAASMSLLVGTGNFMLEGNAASTYTISGTGVNTGTITVDGGTGARTINIANNTGIKTINIAGDSATSSNVIKIGTGAGVQTCTLGSTNTTSTTTINSGSGNTNVTGGHLVIASVAKTLLVNGGAVTDFIGTATLTGGTVTVANTNIATGDIILMTRTTVNGSLALGELTYSISNATSFTVTSMGVTTGTILAADVSSFAYFIIRQF